MVQLVRPVRPLRIAGYAPEFDRRYTRKSARQRRSVERVLERVEADANHPSLRLEQIDERDGIWSVRGSLSVRLTFEFVGPETIYFRSNCTHDQVYGLRR